MNFDFIEQYIKTHQHENFRYSQLVHAVQKGITTWDGVLGWPDGLKNELQNIIPFTSYTASQVWTSTDGTKKALLTLQDGQQIETVLMEPKSGHWSVCISCEVGCPMNCAFCATGKMGFKRALTAEEITDQVLFWRSEGNEVNSVVFMGMGEPFHNTKSVYQAIDVLRDIYGLGQRHISVSTCGIPAEIVAFGEKYPQLNLAISLHAATDPVRKELMPIARNHSLEEVKQALLTYLRTTKRQLMFEYLLINGVNDGPKDQQALVAYLQAFPKQLIHVNLIRYNQTYRGFEPTPVSRVKHWKQWLITHSISASIRKNLGMDIQGACGQLATAN